ncbi:hypothetical protein DDE82_008478 [Stemphylium lycopersici]|nr:hypothetical protein DDE82_008478 [Stemphylium lycopersici]
MSTTYAMATYSCFSATSHVPAPAHTYSRYPLPQNAPIGNPNTCTEPSQTGSQQGQAVRLKTVAMRFSRASERQDAGMLYDKEWQCKTEFSLYTFHEQKNRSITILFLVYSQMIPVVFASPLGPAQAAAQAQAQAQQQAQSQSSSSSSQSQSQSSATSKSSSNVWLSSSSSTSAPECLWLTGAVVTPSSLTPQTTSTLASTSSFTAFAASISSGRIPVSGSPRQMQRHGYQRQCHGWVQEGQQQQQQQQQQSIRAPLLQPTTVFQQGVPTFDSSPALHSNDAAAQNEPRFNAWAGDRLHNLFLPTDMSKAVVDAQDGVESNPQAE